MSSYLLGVEEEMAEIRETKIQSGLSICIEVTSELILLFWSLVWKQLFDGPALSVGDWSVKSSFLDKLALKLTFI